MSFPFPLSWAAVGAGSTGSEGTLFPSWVFSGTSWGCGDSGTGARVCSALK
jgi:hypothetical protein